MSVYISTDLVYNAMEKYRALVNALHKANEQSKDEIEVFWLESVVGFSASKGSYCRAVEYRRVCKVSDIESAIVKLSSISFKVSYE